MARNATIKETFFLIIYGLYLFGYVHACLPDSDDLATVVQSSPIVLEGRVEETQPSAFQPSDSRFFDVVISVRTVFRGQLDPSGDGESYDKIVVGPFGTSEGGEEKGCFGEPIEVGGEFIVFLNPSGDSSAEDSLRHFRLLARPRLADPESRMIAIEHGCYPDCTTPSKRNPHADLCVDNSYCLNGGTCYVMPTLGLRFCRCTPEFQDVRCQEKQTNIGEKKTPREENPVKEYFFLIAIGSMAALLVLIAVCILLVVLVRWQTIKAKSVESPGNRGIKYRNISTDPENILMTTAGDSPSSARLDIPATQSNVGVQTESTIDTSIPRRNVHSNGGRRFPTNVATPGDKATHDARLSRTRQTQGIRDPGPPHGRTGLNRLSKTGELPVSRVPSQNSNVVLVSYRDRDLSTNCDQGVNNSANKGVWVARPLAKDGATVRGGRSGGLNVVNNPMDPEVESTAV